MTAARRPIRVAILAGEASGDQLGASLARALTERFGRDVELFGVAGPAMRAEGVATFFEQSDLAVMGLGPVIRRLPLLLRRIRETAQRLIEAPPDLLVTVDAPDFTKRVAKRVHAKRPELPIIHWVCPSVWAWRPGRARAMAPYIDRVLCLLPFEPAVLARLGGPDGVFVGHPLVESAERIRPANDEERAARARREAPELLLLPGSRASEIRRLLPVFLEALRTPELAGARVTLPTLPAIESLVRATVAASGVAVSVVVGDAAKAAAFRRARVALAASGTVTLELALAGVPMVAAYRVANWEAAIARRLVKVPSAILPNLVLGENVVPEFIQEAATAPALAAELAGLLGETPARARQVAAFTRLDAVLRPAAGSPSDAAAEAVISLLSARGRIDFSGPSAITSA